MTSIASTIMNTESGETVVLRPAYFDPISRMAAFRDSVDLIKIDPRIPHLFGQYTLFQSDPFYADNNMIDGSLIYLEVTDSVGASWGVWATIWWVGWNHFKWVEIW